MALLLPQPQRWHSLSQYLLQPTICLAHFPSWVERHCRGEEFDLFSFLNRELVFCCNRPHCRPTLGWRGGTLCFWPTPLLRPRSAPCPPFRASLPGLDRNRQPALWLRVQVPEAHNQIAVMLAWSQLRSLNPQ